MQVDAVAATFVVADDAGQGRHLVVAAAEIAAVADSYAAGGAAASPDSGCATAAAVGLEIVLGCVVATAAPVAGVV